MTIDKTKRDEAVKLLNIIHDIYPPYSSDTIAAFVDTLLAAIVPENTTSQPPTPDLNDQVSVPDLWLAKYYDGDWFQFVGETPDQINDGWGGDQTVAQCGILSDIPWRESLHKAVNGRWVRWNPETDQPL